MNPKRQAATCSSVLRKQRTKLSRGRGGARAGHERRAQTLRPRKTAVRMMNAPVALASGELETITCGFGATRVGKLLDRLRLHLATDRFLARHRRDLVWEAGCDYAAMALERLESQLSVTRLATSLFSSIPLARASRPLVGSMRITVTGRSTRR